MTRKQPADAGMDSRIQAVGSGQFSKRFRRELKMALGILLIAFIGMSVISLLGLIFMYLLKNERAKAAAFYCMAIWGMAVAAMGAISLPVNFTAARLAAWAFGFLSVIALIIHVRAKSKAQYMTAYVLVTVSVIAGILKIFL